MNSDRSALLVCAEKWGGSCAGLAPLLDSEGNEEFLIQKELVTLSKLVFRMLTNDLAPQQSLTEAGEIFDRIARCTWHDPFGERYEICTLLAYIAWGNALKLGNEAEVQEWLRIGDVLIQEEFEAKNSLTALFGLADGERAARLQDFVTSGADAFFALLVVRNALPIATWKTVAVARELVAWLSNLPAPGLDAIELAALSSELALAIATGTRLLGYRSETRIWLADAKRLSTGMPKRKIFKGKLLAQRLADYCGRNLVTGFPRRAGVIAAFLTRQGAYHEGLVCRTAAILARKMRGLNDHVHDELIELIDECQYSSEQALLAVYIANLAELKAKEGSPDEALVLLRESVAISYSLGGSLLSTVMLSLGEIQLITGHAEDAVVSFRASVKRAADCRCSSWLAYSRIWLAEALIFMGQMQEARSELLSALVIAEREVMRPESIHALKLLSDVESAMSAQRGRGRRWD
jgi:hypothetical protein